MGIGLYIGFAIVLVVLFELIGADANAKLFLSKEASIAVFGGLISAALINFPKSQMAKIGMWTKVIFRSPKKDLLEEIVGEIHDEHDVDEPVFDIDPMGRTRVDGRMPLDIFNERFGVEISDEDYNTVGGFVFGAIGRELVLGDSVTAHGLCFTVDFLDGRSTLLRVVGAKLEEL